VEYDTFSVDSAALKYAIHVSATYTGDAGDVIDGWWFAPGNHDGMKFSANISLMMMRGRRWRRRKKGYKKDEKE